MRILFVAMPDSVQAAWWINMLIGTNWEIFLFSAYTEVIHDELVGARRITGLIPLFTSGRRVNVLSLVPAPRGWGRAEILVNRITGGTEWREQWWQWAIKRVKPHVVHSLEFQSAGYLCLKVRERMGARFPPWIATNWGSDIYLYGRLEEHRERVRKILAAADYYSAECQRDVALAKEFGLKGRVLPVVPNGGGIDLEQIAALRQPGPASVRRVIVIKGYQSVSGRALTALQAIGLCAAHLTGFQIRLYSATEDVRIAAELLAQNNGLDIACLRRHSAHQEVLRLHGSARVSIEIGISDGISTSFLEAMAIGALPIQSCTACAYEWVEDGVSGFMVPPDDPTVIAERIVQAVTDDDLVDKAAEINRRTVEERLDRRRIREIVVDTYQDIYREIQHGRT